MIAASVAVVFNFCLSVFSVVKHKCITVSEQCFNCLNFNVECFTESVMYSTNWFRLMRIWFRENSEKLYYEIFTYEHIL